MKWGQTHWIKFLFFSSALRVSSRQQNKAVSSDFSKSSRFLKHDLLHSMSWLNSKWVVKLSMSHHFPTYSRTIVFFSDFGLEAYFQVPVRFKYWSMSFSLFFRLVIGRWPSLIWRLTDLKGKGEQALYTNPVKLQEGGCRMWLQALTSGFQRMRVKVTFVRTEKYMLLTVFWIVTLFAEHVTLMEAAVVMWLCVGFLWHNRSFLLRSNVQYITLYWDTDRTNLIIY